MGNEEAMTAKKKHMCRIRGTGHAKVLISQTSFIDIILTHRAREEIIKTLIF